MKLTEFSVKNYQFTLILFAALMAMGIGSLLNMPRGEDPDFQAPQFAIVVVYPGTSPADMEKLIADPLEKRVNEMDDIKVIKTRIDDGLLVARVDFKYESDPDKKYQDMVREVAALKSELPQEILALNILKFSPSDVNIVQVGLVSEVASYKELEENAKRLKESLEKVKSLKNVNNYAFPKQQVRVSIDLTRLAANKVPLNNVLFAIQSENSRRLD
jgi:multidrug efflux pump subunit AcrB